MINLKVHDDPATMYAQKVLTNKIVGSQHIRNVCRRHISDLTDTKKKNVYKYIPQLAQRFEKFASKLTVTDTKTGGVKKFEFLLFQKFLAHQIFGWVNDINNPSGYIPGTRKYRQFVFYTAKGNGKTPFINAITLFMISLDGYYHLIDNKWMPEINPLGYITATNQQQAADLGISRCKQLLAYSPKVQKHFGFVFGKAKTPKKFYCEKTNGVIESLTSITEGSGKSGPIISYIHAEEPHEWNQESIQLDILLSGAKSRPQQLCIIASNAPKTMDGICWDWKIKAQKACETHNPENVSGFIAECDPDDFPDRSSKRVFPYEKVWTKANPGLGEIQPARAIKDRIASAHTVKEVSEVKRLNFGLVPGDAGGLFERSSWDDVQVEKLTDEEFNQVYAPENTHLFMALDLAEKTNFAALGELYVPNDGNIPLLKVRYWTPSVGLQDRDKKSTGHLLTWVQKGFIIKVHGSVIGYKVIGRHISNLCNIYTNYDICADPSHLRQFVNDCVTDGINMEALLTQSDFKNSKDRGQIRIINHAQGAYANSVTGLGMDESINDLRTVVLDQMIAVEHNPATDWCLEYCQLKANEHNMLKLDKKTATKHGKGTDDGVVVTAMVAGLWQKFVRDQGVKKDHSLKYEYEKDESYNPFVTF